MIVYEVNVDVEPAIAQDYAAWLDAHIDQMIALPGFVGAARYRRDADDPFPSADTRLDSTPLHWTIHYQLRDRAALDAYLRDHAPRMREDGAARFGAAFTATRRILEPVD